MKMHKIGVVVLGLAMASAVFAAGGGNNVKSEQAKKVAAAEGGRCADEGTLSSLTDPSPFICASGTWQKVTFKQDEKGEIEKLVYEGKCALRLEDEGDHHVDLEVTRSGLGSLVDICLPAGYRPAVVVQSDNLNWRLEPVHSIQNVFFVASRPYDSTSGTVGKTKNENRIYLYARKPDGKLSERFVIDVRNK